MNTKPITLKLQHITGKTRNVTETTQHRMTTTRTYFYEFERTIEANKYSLGELSPQLSVHCPHCSKLIIPCEQMTILVIKGSDIKKVSTRLKYDSYYSYLFDPVRFFIHFFSSFFLIGILAIIIGLSHIDHLFADNLLFKYVNNHPGLSVPLIFIIGFILFRIIYIIKFFRGYDKRSYAIKLPKLKEIKQKQLDFYNVFTDVKVPLNDHDISNYNGSHNWITDQYPFLNQLMELTVKTEII